MTTKQRTIIEAHVSIIIESDDSYHNDAVETTSGEVA
jgi:hypothetical protein